MKTKRAVLGLCAGVFGYLVLAALAGPSLPVTKPPVVPLEQLTGPPVDPPALNGQWFQDSQGGQTNCTHEFHDNTFAAGGGNAGEFCIQGQVVYVEYLFGPGVPGDPITSFVVQASISNNLAESQTAYAGSNSHGESREQVGSYVGRMLNTKLAVEFAIADAGNVPAAFVPPYRDAIPWIVAANEHQTAWYCWSPEGGFYVPVWNFGNIGPGETASDILAFTVPAGLPSTDPRYATLEASYNTGADIFLNRATSLKISTWIDDVAVDKGDQQVEPPLRFSNVSVFHDVPDLQSLDFGDAPDSADAGVYPTLLVNDGARHVYVPGIQMNGLDVETDGQPTANADGDDTADVADEDGVTFFMALTAGESASVNVEVSYPPGGFLSAWVDFNADGDWDDPGENVASAKEAIFGINQITFDVPGGAAIGNTYARFRFSTDEQAVLTYAGLAPDGEVEDYLVEIQEGDPYDFGDAPTPYPTVLPNGARHAIDPAVYLGALLDAEANGRPSVNADGDDLDNLADEDGVTFATPLVAGNTATVDVTCAVSGSLWAWIDFGADNSWAQPEDEILSGVTVPAGTSSQSFTVPASAAGGNAYARFRFTTNPEALSYVGLAPDGEVEDYLVEIRQEQADLDFGDAPEGALAYPGTPTLGQFPTCMTVGPAAWIQHGLGWARFGMGPGPAWDAEADGNAGICPVFNPTYDLDECFADGDAGLLGPTSYTITGPVGAEVVATCPGSASGTALGTVCQTATWGTDVDIFVVNGMPVAGYVNMLMDWDQNGIWGGVSTCPGGSAPEHVLVNCQVPIGFSGPLSALLPPPPSFRIGPNPGYVWARFTITEIPVPTQAWDGSGIFEDGETEDYLLQVNAAQEPDLDFGDAPDAVAAPRYPTLLANNGANHVIVPGFCLGNLVDAEQDGQPDPQALGDDNNPPVGLDDEDGVTFPTALFSGVPSRVQVVATVPAGVSAYFSMWIDYNGDGDWTDAGEQAVADNGVVNGIQWYPFTPGAITAATSTFVRCRLSTARGLTEQGPAPDGEVEDYEIPLVPVKWLQRPDATSNGVDVDNSIVHLADDFRCTMSGPITDVHVWTSFFDDMVPAYLTNMTFSLFIYKDVPAAGQNHSHPGELLWSRKFAPGTYQAGLISAGTPEWWHNPPQAFWIPAGDSRIYQFDFYMPAGEEFVQTEGLVYWLGIKYDQLEPGGFQLGWKSSLEHWNDDACWLDESSGVPIWRELRYGGDHPLAPDSMDLAFALTGVAGEEPDLDFGDAPDQPYPTLLANNGARHVIVTGVWMGNLVDPEADGQPDATATGDDYNNADDEEGVNFTSSMYVGGSATFDVICSAAGYLSVWIDFNADGDWLDAGENVFATNNVVAGTNTFAFAIPGTAAVGNTFMRFRYTTWQVPLADTGLAPDGEVEDYVVAIAELPKPEADLGDAPDSSNSLGLPMTVYPGGLPPLLPAAYPTVYQLGSPPFGPIHFNPANGVFLGGAVTFENEADVGVDADGVNNILPATDTPDQDGQDDGVQFPLVLPHCRSTRFTYWLWPVAPPPAPVYVNVWFDWNRDGDWNDLLNCPDGTVVPEWAVQNQMLALAPMPSPIPQQTPAFMCWHPAGGVQPLWMRITLAEQVWPGPLGFGGAGGDGPSTGYQLGETEDYIVADYAMEEELDFGDAPDPTYPTRRPGNGARHGVIPGFSLGRQIDAEADGQPNAAATGDDVNPPLGIDDEDGVVFTNQILIGRQGCLDVFLSSGPAGGKLDAWVDFNADGVWGPAEQVLNGLVLVPGVNSNVCFNVPIGAVLGPTFARFRLSSAGGLAPAGAAQDGEVEDYLVAIYQPRNASGNLAVTNILRVSASTAAVWWASADAGLHYQLQSTVDLTNGAGQVWSNVGPHVIGPSNWQIDTSLPASRFYRVLMPWTP